MQTIYDFPEQAQMITPQLIYYADYIEQNIAAMIRRAGSVDRLWPHVKTHKMAEVVKMQLEAGIRRFKCATIAEAEMTAETGARQIALAYPLIGPNIGRFLALCKRYPEVEFFAIGDDTDQIRSLGEVFHAEGRTVQLLLDVDTGQHRTGVAPAQSYELFIRWERIPGIHLRGLHCYDGQRHEHDFTERLSGAQIVDQTLLQIKERLLAEGYDCTILIMGGSPSFPCHQQLTDEFLSPGTCIIQDAGYRRDFPDMDYIPAGVVLTRVISRPKENWFTLDMGAKAVASDPPHERAVIVGMEYVKTVIHNEEHWVVEVPPEHLGEIPPVGTELFAVPTHICPTSALYQAVPVIRNSRLADWWEVTARNRKLTI